MLLKQSAEYVDRVYSAITKPEPIPADYRAVWEPDTPKFKLFRNTPNHTGIRYMPGQRPGEVLPDGYEPNRKRRSYYERGELTESEFKRQADTFAKQFPETSIAYMSHPLIAVDIREWFTGLCPVEGRYNAPHDVAAALQRYLRKRRWPVTIIVALTNGLLERGGFERGSHGWAVAYRHE
jgi:hypothetical protein